MGQLFSQLWRSWFPTEKKIVMGEWSKGWEATSAAGATLVVVQRGTCSRATAAVARNIHSCHPPRSPIQYAPVHAGLLSSHPLPRRFALLPSTAHLPS